MAEYLNSTTDMVYSEDEKGWYLMQFKGLKVRMSQLFKSRHECLNAWKMRDVQWDKWE